MTVRRFGWANTTQVDAQSMADARAEEALQQILAGEKLQRREIEKFLGAHPDWGVRLYRTPVGLRLIATHQTFDPLPIGVRTFFTAIGVDPIYAPMCEPALLPCPPVSQTLAHRPARSHAAAPRIVAGGERD